MTNAIIALQQAVYTSLTADTTLMGLVEGVFDSVPQGTAFPYAVFGPVKAKDWSTIATSGLQIALQLDVYSRQRGRAECVAILDRIYALIHRAALTVSGHTLMDIYFMESTITQENDGLTFKGSIVFRANIQE